MLATEDFGGKAGWSKMTTNVGDGTTAIVRCVDCLHAHVKPGTGGREWRCESPTRELVGGQVYRSDGRTFHWNLTRLRECAAYTGLG